MSLYLRELFPILEDNVSGFGVGPTRVQVGTSPITGGPNSGLVNGMMVLAFQDVNGNLVLPQLDSLGRLPVTDNAVNVPLYGYGALANGVTSGLTIIAGTTLTLVPTKKYADIDFVVACSRTTEAQVVWNNAGVESVLADVLVGAGEYSFSPNLNNLQFTAGVSGTQQLYMKVNNLEKASQITATLVANQISA